MKTEEAVTALSALAQPSRLELFRLLVRRGPAGLPAGEIAERIGIPATTLSFHLGQLTRAGLLRARRHGRSIVYGADYARMGALVAFLSEHCCQESPCDVPMEEKEGHGDKTRRSRYRARSGTPGA
jgi:DNA-binding transcriptional ArsR family regulator